MHHPLQVFHRELASASSVDEAQIRVELDINEQTSISRRGLRREPLLCLTTRCTYMCTAAGRQLGLCLQCC